MTKKILRSIPAGKQRNEFSTYMSNNKNISAWVALRELYSIIDGTKEQVNVLHNDVSKNSRWVKTEVPTSNKAEIKRLVAQGNRLQEGSQEKRDNNAKINALLKNPGTDRRSKSNSFCSSLWYTIPMLYQTLSE